jgi:flagellar biosynthesis protein FlhB
MSEEKSFKPTQRKLDRARKDGQVLKSQLLGQLAVLSAGLGLIWAFGGQIWVAPRMLLEYGLSQPDLAVGALLDAAKVYVIQAVAVIVGGFAVVGVVAELAQVRFSLEPAVLVPKMERIDPVAGMKRLAGSLVQGWEPLLRIAIVLTVGVLAIQSLLTRLAAASWSDVSAVVTQGQLGLLALAKWLVLAFAIGAAFDYFRRHREFYRDLSMDHHEMMEEHKELEGQPLVKALRRAMHESLAMQDVERRVRSAKVIVVRKAAAK